MSRAECPGGRLIAVVGPSGAGKDTLMEAAIAARPALYRVRRVVTRPEGAGGEDLEAVSEAEFAARLAAGGFSLHWRAHGLGYAVPAEVEAMLAGGRDALANLSRGVLTEARARFPRLLVLNVTAPPEVLAARLRARGREEAEEIQARLARPAILPEDLAVVTIVNDGPLERALDAMLAALDAAPAPAGDLR